MKILIVEDEAIIALLVEQVLVTLGHEVMTVARTAGMAFDIARRSTPDLALLDIRLAGGSGVEVARWLKQRGVPSIFMTASLIEAEANRDAVLGCISKPFTDRDVERAVRWAETRQGACAVA